MSRREGGKRLFVVLGNQLFPWEHVGAYRDAAFFMAEDVGLCTYVRHHKQKIVLFLAAMRSYADELRRHGCTVHYKSLDDADFEDKRETYESELARFIHGKGFAELVVFEIEDHFFEDRIEAFAEQHKLRLTVLPSLMFVTSRREFAEYLEDAGVDADPPRRPLMAKFYERQRKRLDVLVDANRKPIGGKWSFDADNRRSLPKDVAIPETDWAKPTPHVEAVCGLVRRRFADHPGLLPGESLPGDATLLGEAGAPEHFWLPTTRKQALSWLGAFLKDRFADFGPYEDAISNRGDVLFHSVLSPMLNLGLLTPHEVVERAVAYAHAHGGLADGKIPLNSLEGFVRQVIGWREFVRGIYHHYDAAQSQANFWNHHRKFRGGHRGGRGCWYDGTTGLPPLDDAIRRCVRLGWTHHIERLMVLGNLMNLCEIEPREAHRWFMEMFVDSSDWVMGPNVYGMGLMSDGGVFATKPYLCGSNYLLKMSDHTKASSAPWAETMDGLYWRFIDRHRDFFAGNPRLSVMPATLDKMKPDRRERIFKLAEAFIDRVTEPSA